MSIFSKICPRCAGDNQVEVTHCQCGFVFEASATTGSYHALEMAEQEARVYAEYLQARVRQAKETAEVAINDQARSLGDDAKMAMAKTANDDFLQAKSEYDEQMKLVLQLQKESAKAQALEKKEQETAWEKAKKRTKGKAILAEKAALAAKQEELEEAARELKIQERAQQVAAEKAEKLRLKKLKTKAAKAAIAKMAGQKSPPPKMQEKMALDAEAAAIRVRQANSSIHKELQAASSALKTNTLATDPAGQPTPSPEISPAVAKKKITVNADEKDCPNCTAVVRTNTKECKCGYTFPQGTELMDSIGLSEEDSANLLSMFQSGNNT